MKSIVLAPILALAVFAASTSAQSNWPQFRGPSAASRSEARNLPTTFSANTARWKTPIHGRAWSSPVVRADQIWLTTATLDGTKLSALCIDKNSGKVLHDLKLFDNAKPQYAHPFNTYASPTPTIEQGRVYVTFGSPGTACLDTATAKVLWTRTDFVCNHFRGAGSSPILFENLLIMHFDGSDNQFVVALDKSTGQTVWKTNRSIDFKDLGPDGKPEADGDWRKAFSTPVITTFNGQPLMISLASKACYAYDPRTGREIWRIEERACHSGSSTPVVGDGMVYVCMGHARGQLYAIRLGGQGLLNDSNVAWKVRRNIPTRGTPVLVDGLLYVVDDGGIATCLDAKTGQEIWRQRLKGDSFSASPIYADNRIYFFSETGPITVITPGRQFQVIAESQLDDGFMATPALSDSSFYLRTKSALFRFQSAQ